MTNQEQPTTGNTCMPAPANDCTLSTPILPGTRTKRRNTLRKKETKEHLYTKLPVPLIPDDQEPAILPVFDQPVINPRGNLLQLFVKKGEYVYARPCDIVLVESCDHMVQVYVACGEKVKRAVRNGSLKDFLMQLPQHQFVRLSRFCAVNLNRLSGGNYNQQLFEFDFRVSIKLKHTLPVSVFKTIGT